MKIPMLLIVIIISPVPTKQDLSGRCDMAKCGTTSTLVSSSEEKILIAIEETKATLYTWPEYEDIIYTKRRRFTAYCYNGASLDLNDGCDKSMRSVPISMFEATQYTTDNICKTGCECNVDKCTGSASECCNNDALTTTNGPKKMGDISYDYAGWARHSCTSKWECIAEKVTVQPIVSKRGHTIYRGVEAFNKMPLEMGTFFYREGLKFDDDSIYYPTVPEPNPVVLSVRPKCYSSSMEDAHCLLNVNGREIPFKIDMSTLTGEDRNMILVINGKIKTVSNGEITEVSKEDSNVLNNGELTVEALRQRAASIEDVNEMLSGIKITQLQEISNVMSNRNSIIEVKRVMTKMVGFLSKKYPLFLSDLFDKSYKTRWVNKDVFQMCPCISQIDIPPYSNCVRDIMYKDGETIKTNNPAADCFSLGSEEIKNISVFESKDILDLTTIDYLPPKASASDDPIWDKIFHSQNDAVDYKNLRSDYSNLKSIVDSINPYFSFKDILLYFSTVMAVIFLMEKVVRNR